MCVIFFLFWVVFYGFFLINIFGITGKVMGGRQALQGLSLWEKVRCYPMPVTAGSSQLTMNPPQAKAEPERFVVPL